jgi:hypothetical protein
MQGDWGEGPRVTGRRTSLWCALAGVVTVSGGDPGVGQDLAHDCVLFGHALRRSDGVPTYALTDNEKTVTIDHVARIAVRNPEIVEVGRHHGLTIRTCIPADPQTTGGSENTVKIAKADLVPTAANLLESYRTFGEFGGGLPRILRTGQQPATSLRPAMS